MGGRGGKSDTAKGSTSGGAAPEKVDYGEFALKALDIKAANMSAESGKVPQSVSGDAIQQEYARVAGELETQMASSSLITESQKEEARSNLRDIVKATITNSIVGDIDGAQYDKRLMESYMWDVANEIYHAESDGTKVYIDYPRSLIK